MYSGEGGAALAVGSESTIVSVGPFTSGSYFVTATGTLRIPQQAALTEWECYVNLNSDVLGNEALFSIPPEATVGAFAVTAAIPAITVRTTVSVACGPLGGPGPGGTANADLEVVSVGAVHS